MHSFDAGVGALVVLHGHGDEPASAAAWGRRIAPSGWEVEALDAPRGPDGLRSWFSTGARGADPDELTRSAHRVVDLVARLRGGGRPVVVAGFSQGAAVTLSLGLAAGAGPASADRPGRPDAVVSVCGFLPEAADGSVPTDADTAAAAPPVLLVAGSEDEVTPSFLSEDAAAVLGRGGRDVTVVVESGGHAVTSGAIDLVRRWMARTSARPVRVSLGLPVDRVDAGPELVSGDAIAELAASYERHGFHAAYVTDHPAPDDRWLTGGGHQAMEPTVALSVAAAATRHLLLHTNVYVLGYRNPFLAAKALASLDVVSSGRLVLGVAAGYLRPEFRALGVDFDDRTRRLEDALSLLPRIWSEDSLAVRGPGYDAAAVTARPRPVQRPHPPIWVGGNSRAAIRRAVTLAQGWSPFPTPPGMEVAVRTAAIPDIEHLRRRLVTAAEMCEEHGRTEPLTTCFVPFSLGAYLEDPDAGIAAMVEEVAELEASGIDWVALSVPGSTRPEVLERTGQLAEALGLRASWGPAAPGPS